MRDCLSMLTHIDVVCVYVCVNVCLSLTMFLPCYDPSSTTPIGLSPVTPNSYPTSAALVSRHAPSLLANLPQVPGGVQGVSVGAILSDYQRVRVENVCGRLSLVPLAYLWRQSQSALLADMIHCGTEAVLIKVCG